MKKEKSFNPRSIELAIKKMIERNQRIIVISNEGGEGKEGVGGTKPAIKRHLELQKKTVQDAPRDTDTLQALLKVKEEEKSCTISIWSEQILALCRISPNYPLMWALNHDLIPPISNSHRLLLSCSERMK